MSLTYWIPFFIVVLGNIGYHMVAKARRQQPRLSWPSA